MNWAGRTGSGGAKANLDSGVDSTIASKFRPCSPRDKAINGQSKKSYMVIIGKQTLVFPFSCGEETRVVPGPSREEHGVWGEEWQGGVCVVWCATESLYSPTAQATST